MADVSEPIPPRRFGAFSPTTVVHVTLGLCILGGLVWLARDLEAGFVACEAWIASLGTTGWLVFVVAAVLLMAVFVPSSLFGALAGALFGMGWGTAAMGIAGLITAAITWLVASDLLRDRISSLLQRYPRLQAIQRAVRNEGMQLQVMLRLAPINAVSINYVLGAAGIRFRPYMVAALGMLPGLFVEVYFGHLARHVSKVAGNTHSGSTLETGLKVAGFIICVVTLIVVGRMARKAVADAETRAGDGSREEPAATAANP